MTDTSFRLPIQLNPLRFFALEEALPRWESVVADLAGAPGDEHDLQPLRERYAELEEATQLFAFPSVPALEEKLLRPLRNAKASYVLGDYLACVALAGMVAEMVAIVLYDVRGFTINGNRLTPEKQKAIFGSTVEKMGQERKIQLLEGLSAISEEERANLTLIKEVRRKYLHLYSHPHENVRSDSRAVFLAAASVVASLLGLGTGDGLMSLDDRFVRYLRRAGIIESETTEQPTVGNDA